MSVPRSVRARRAVCSAQIGAAFQLEVNEQCPYHNGEAAEQEGLAHVVDRQPAASKPERGEVDVHPVRARWLREKRAANSYSFPHADEPPRVTPGSHPSGSATRGAIEAVLSESPRGTNWPEVPDLQLAFYADPCPTQSTAHSIGVRSLT
jgi:hypothetical protein